MPIPPIQYATSNIDEMQSLPIIHIYIYSIHTFVVFNDCLRSTIIRYILFSLETEVEVSYCNSSSSSFARIHLLLFPMTQKYTTLYMYCCSGVGLYIYIYIHASVVSFCLRFPPNISFSATYLLTLCTQPSSTSTAYHSTFTIYTLI